jgi:hypothetical protein
MCRVASLVPVITTLFGPQIKIHMFFFGTKHDKHTGGSS